MTVKTIAQNRHHENNSEVEVCCEEFASAVQCGTDNEEYDALIRTRNNGRTWYMGSGPNLISYCPFCGIKISTTPKHCGHCYGTGKRLELGRTAYNCGVCGGKGRV